MKVDITIHAEVSNTIDDSVEGPFPNTAGKASLNSFVSYVLTEAQEYENVSTTVEVTP